MPIAIDPDNETFDYVLKRELETEPSKQSIFELKYLSIDEEQRVLRELKKDDNAGGMLLLKIGLRGWRNYLKADGENAPFDLDNDGMPTKKTIGRLIREDRLEIANAIQSHGKITEEERGK